MMSLLNKLEKKLNNLCSQKRFLLIASVLVITLLTLGVLLDRGFKTRESPAEPAPGIGIEQSKDCVPTSQDVEGPYFRPNAPVRDSIAPPDAKGKSLIISGTIYHSDCKTLVTQLSAGVPQIEVWHANNTGEYDNTTSNYWYRGAIPVDSQGRYQFETIRPGNYLDGGGYRPAHIHFKVTVPGYRPLTTQLYFKDDPYLGANDSCGPCNSEDPTLVVELGKELNHDPSNPTAWFGAFNIVLEPIEPQVLDTSNWQTYRNEEFGFRYPQDWLAQKGEPGMLLIQPIEGSTRITISSFDPSVRGISYCEDQLITQVVTSRCERFVTKEQVYGIIDWDIGKNAAYAILKNLSLILTVESPAEIDSSIKEFFRTFLSTFRFVE